MNKFKPRCWHLPRPSKSRYKGSYPLHFETKFKQFIRSSDYLHLFSGKAETGFKVDLKIENKPDIVADVHHLPFRDQSFPAALADPPYNDKYAKRLYNTPKLKLKQFTNEIVRVVKSGGIIAFYHLMLFPNPDKCEYLGVITIITRVFHHARVVTVFQKEGRSQLLDQYL